MEKIRIQDKHPESASLVTGVYYLFKIARKAVTGTGIYWLY
jgi:hypothetical protein